MLLVDRLQTPVSGAELDDARGIRIGESG